PAERQDQPRRGGATAGGWRVAGPDGVHADLRAGRVDGERRHAHAGRWRDRRRWLHGPAAARGGARPPDGHDRTAARFREHRATARRPQLFARVAARSAPLRDAVHAPGGAAGELQLLVQRSARDVGARYLEPCGHRGAPVRRRGLVHQLRVLRLRVPHPAVAAARTARRELIDSGAGAWTDRPTKAPSGAWRARQRRGACPPQRACRSPSARPPSATERRSRRATAKIKTTSRPRSTSAMSRSEPRAWRSWSKIRMPPIPRLPSGPSCTGSSTTCPPTAARCRSAPTKARSRPALAKQKTIGGPRVTVALSLPGGATATSAGLTPWTRPCLIWEPRPRRTSTAPWPATSWRRRSWSARSSSIEPSGIETGTSHGRPSEVRLCAPHAEPAADQPPTAHPARALVDRRSGRGREPGGRVR